MSETIFELVRLDQIFKDAIDFENDPWVPSLAAVEASVAKTPLQRHHWRYELDKNLFHATLTYGAFPTKTSSGMVITQGMAIRLASGALKANDFSKTLPILDDEGPEFEALIHAGRGGWLRLDPNIALSFGMMLTAIVAWLDVEPDNLETYCCYNRHRVSLCFKNADSKVQVHVLFAPDMPDASVEIEDRLWQRLEA